MPVFVPFRESYIYKEAGEVTYHSNDHAASMKINIFLLIALGMFPSPFLGFHKAQGNMMTQVEYF